MKTHAVALGAAVGALVAWPIPAAVVAVGVVVAVVRRTALALALGTLVLVSLLGHRAIEGLDPSAQHELRTLGYIK